MPNRAQDWLRQAERDLEQAEDSRRASRHEWASFVLHQRVRAAGLCASDAFEVGRCEKDEQDSAPETASALFR
jgi:hypothetical protein